MRSLSKFALIPLFLSFPFVNACGGSQPKKTAKQEQQDQEEEIKKFIGTWQVYSAIKETIFYITLNPEGTASRSNDPEVMGVWRYINGQVWIVWDDGWRESLELNGDTVVKLGWPPTLNREDPPFARSEAKKVKPLVAEFVGVWEVDMDENYTDTQKRRITIDPAGTAMAEPLGPDSSQLNGKWTLVDERMEINWDDGSHLWLTREGPDYVRYFFSDKVTPSEWRARNEEVAYKVSPGNFK